MRSYVFLRSLREGSKRAIWRSRIGDLEDLDRRAIWSKINQSVPVGRGGHELTGTPSQREFLEDLSVTTRPIASHVVAIEHVNCLALSARDQLMTWRL